MLNEFFRINLPYGLKQNSNGEWSAFNREYIPLGWNDMQNKDDDITTLPIHTKYKGLTEKKLKSLLPEERQIQYDEKGNITRVFFYNDATNPETTGKWEAYFKIIKGLSGLAKAK